MTADAAKHPTPGDDRFAIRYTRAQIDADVAAAVLAERGRCADAAHNAIHDAIYEMGECERVKSAVLDALADGPAPDGADALAAALAQARREALEEAAAVALRVPIPEDCSGNEAHGRIAGSVDAAMAIRALLPAPDAALLRDFTRWTEGTSDE